MKKIIPIIILIIFFISGCTSPIKNELFEYVNVLIPSVSSLEDEALSKYENMINDDSLSSEEMHLILEKEIIPVYGEFVNKLEKIDLKTEDMKKIHNIYVEGSRTQLKAFVLISNGLYEKNNSAIEEANTHIDKAKEHMSNFKDEIKSLASTLKVRYE